MKVRKVKLRDNLGVKPGYTLIELIVVLGILSVVPLIMYPSVEIYNDKQIDIEMDYTVDGIIEFINGAKSYARLENSIVMVKFSGRSISLIKGTKKISEFELYSSINNIVLSDNINSIEITGYGSIKKAKSIYIYSCNGRNETITIKVGTSYVSVQK